MTTPQWERAKEIFAAALDLPPEARSSYLLQRCKDNLELRREVESLLAADAEAGSFLDPGWLVSFCPPAAEPEFQLIPGDLLSGRFRIVRSLGDGGMGRVYEAHDSVLGVQVALKTLRPEISANPEVLFRFRQEVRIAHRITHPNVCRTYHLDHEVRRIGDDDSSSVDLNFLTMEFLEGETLQQLLKRNGRLPLPQALMIARQMAQAIDAAHRTGVIHRDIKPSNVMICPARFGEQEDRIVVTDFGLAKFEIGAAGNDHSSISRPGHAMGTLAYMSPEQLKGKEVGPATDIYAFGLVLYEMATGVKAFPGSNTIEVAYHRTVDPPPSPRAIVPDLPRAWETAVLACLQIEPLNRLQHATDVVAVLEGSAPYSSRWRPRQASKPTYTSGLRRKTVVTSLAIVASLSLFAAGFRYFLARGDAAVTPGALVYLAPVKNETGDKQLDNVTELVQAGMEQSTRLNLLDAGRVGDLLQQMTKSPEAVIDQPMAREIAMRAGAVRVVFLSLSNAVDKYRLDVDIQQPDNTPLRPRSHTAKSWYWTNATGRSTIPPELLDVVRDSSDWIRRAVGESATDLAQLDVPPEDATTSSWDALTAYNHAQKLALADNPTGAVIALREAVRIDPEFALAYARLGDILCALRQYDDGLKAYLQALARGADRRLSRRERDRIKAMYAIDTLDYQAADLALRDSLGFYENDSFSWAYRVQPLIMLGHPEDALTSLHKVLQLNPRSEFGLAELASILLYLGRKEEAAAAIERLRAAGHTDNATGLSVNLKVLQGQLDGAEATALTLEQATNPEFRIRSLPLLASIRAEQGDYAGALGYLNHAVLDSEVSARPSLLSTVLLDRALLHARLGDIDSMLADVDSALQHSANNQHRIVAASVLGQAALQTNSSARNQIINHLRHILSSLSPRESGTNADLAQLLLRGEIQLAGNDWNRAVATFRAAANRDAPAGQREYLGRALQVAAAHQHDPAARRALQLEAMHAYAAIALRPGAVWFHPLDLPAGFLAGQLQAYLQLADSLHAPDAETAEPRAMLQSLRVAAAEPLRSPKPSGTPQIN